MDLKTYFENAKGTGVFATANATGVVNQAIYARPHFMDDGTIAFIMRDRLTHANIKQNPYASYLFIEEGTEYNGKRMHLKMVAEEKNTEKLYSLRRRKYDDDKKGDLFLVFFSIEEELELVGTP